MLNLKTLILGRVITKDEINHLTEITNETIETFSRFYDLTEVEFLEKLENGKIRYRGFIARMLGELFLVILISVFSAFTKRKN